MEFKEFRAKTVEDAEIDAARAFGVVTADLEVQVIEKGSAGFLGIGAKQAVIRVRVKEDTLAETETKNTEEALMEVFKKLRPGEPATIDSAKKQIDNLFFDPP